MSLVKIGDKWRNLDAALEIDIYEDSRLWYNQHCYADIWYGSDNLVRIYSQEEADQLSKYVEYRRDYDTVLVGI